MQRWPFSVKICASAASTRELGVGVLEHDDRRLAAELDRGALERRCAGRDHALPVVGSPVKQIRSTPGCARQRGAGRLAEAVDDVEDAVGQLGLLEHLGEQRRGEGRPLGRLEHDRVARRERRRDPPRREHQRRVPGHDQPGHADRLVDRVVEELVADLERAAVQLGDHARVVVEVLAPRARRGPRICAIGMPMSSTSRSMNSSACSRIRSAMRRSTAARSVAFRRGQGPRRTRAGRRAPPASTSARWPSATSARGSFVAGSSVSNVPPVDARRGTPRRCSVSADRNAGWGCGHPGRSFPSADRSSCRPLSAIDSLVIHQNHIRFLIRDRFKPGCKPGHQVDQTEEMLCARSDP